VMLLLYMTPVLGIITWTLAGVLGLGASTLAFMAAYRREYPKKPKRPKEAKDTKEQPPAAVDEPPFAPGAQAGAVEAAPALVPETPAVVHETPVSDAPPQQTSFGFPRAEFVERLAAFTLDVILILIVANVFDLDRYHDGPLGRVGMMLAIAYHVGFWTWKG